jgi:hypothetical protein
VRCEAAEAGRAENTLRWTVPPDVDRLIPAVAGLPRLLRRSGTLLEGGTPVGASDSHGLGPRAERTTMRWWLIKTLRVLRLLTGLSSRLVTSSVREVKCVWKNTRYNLYYGR